MQALTQFVEGSVEGLPNRIHEVINHYVVTTPNHPALIDDEMRLTYRELDQAVDRVAGALQALGIRAGDRMMIVSENSIPLACLLLAASRLDVWSIVVNPRLSPRELDQIRDHSGARRVLLTADVSQEAAAHAARYEAVLQDVGPLRGVAVTGLNLATTTEPVEADEADHAVGEQAEELIDEHEHSVLHVPVKKRGARKR